MKRFLVTGLASGATALALIVGGVTVSQAAPGSAPAAQATATATATPGKPQAGTGGQRQRPTRAIQSLLDAAVELTGLEKTAIVQELRAGKSLSQIVQANGSTADALIAAGRTKFAAKLQESVTAGNMTQEQADAALARYDTEAPTAIDQTNVSIGGGQRGGARGMGNRALVQATATVTGLTAEEVQAELQAGKSMAQIAQEHGKTADDILNELSTKGQARLADMLAKANELINQPGGVAAPTATATAGA